MPKPSAATLSNSLGAWLSQSIQWLAGCDEARYGLRLPKVPLAHVPERFTLLANLIRALPQLRLARPRRGSPPHPISTEGNQRS